MLKGSKHSQATLKKISSSKKGTPAWNKGKVCPWTSERNKLGKGKKFTEEHKKKISDSSKKGSESVHWKGQEVQYRSSHQWIVNTFGQPDKCEHCNIDGLSGRKIHWANKNHKYKREIKDWLRLCAKCHLAYDKKNGLRKHKKGEYNFA